MYSRLRFAVDAGRRTEGTNGVSLRGHHRDGIDHRDLTIPLKVSSIERENVRQPVPLHRGDEAGVVGLLPLDLVRESQRLPDVKDRAVAKNWKEQLPFVYQLVYFVDRKPQAVLLGRPRSDRPKLINYLRNESECVLLIFPRVHRLLGDWLLRAAQMCKPHKQIRVDEDPHSPRILIRRGFHRCFRGYRRRTWQRTAAAQPTPREISAASASVRGDLLDSPTSRASRRALPGPELRGPCQCPRRLGEVLFGLGVRCKTRFISASSAIHNTQSHRSLSAAVPHSDQPAGTPQSAKIGDICGRNWTRISPIDEH